MIKIYKIISSQTDKIYIGSTKQRLGRRFDVHKSDSKNKNTERCSSHQLINNFNDCKIELIEEVNKEDRYIRERYWIDFFGINCVNIQIPLRTKKQWADDNKIYHQSQIKNWRQENNFSITCECGCKILRQNISTHRKTKKHLKFLESQ
jgi:hypothetical protein